jgi:hypothetical protein
LTPHRQAHWRRPCGRSRAAAATQPPRRSCSCCSPSPCRFVPCDMLCNYATPCGLASLDACQRLVGSTLFHLHWFPAVHWHFQWLRDPFVSSIHCTDCRRHAHIVLLPSALTGANHGSAAITIYTSHFITEWGFCCACSWRSTSARGAWTRRSGGTTPWRCPATPTSPPPSAGTPTSSCTASWRRPCSRIPSSHPRSS